jgi:hypothetical protein
MNRLRPLLAVALLGLAACRIPAAHLPNRQVDDPITLPAGTLTLGTKLSFDRALSQTRRLGIDDLLLGDLRWGITDRLELAMPAMLHYRLLDERPTGARPPDRLSLALVGGLGGLFHGVLESGIGPAAGLRVGKRIAPPLALWAEGTAMLITRTAPTLSTSGQELSAYAGATVQIVPRVAVDMGATLLRGSGRRPLLQDGGVVRPVGILVEVRPGATIRVRLAWWMDLALSAGISRARWRQDDPSYGILPGEAPLAAIAPETGWAGHGALLATFRW